MLLCLLAFGALGLSGSAAEGETYYRAVLSHLEIAEGSLPEDRDGSPAGFDWERAPAMEPRVVLDGPGEAYVSIPAPERTAFGETLGTYVDWNRVHLFARTPSGGTITGALFLPRGDWSGMERIRFSLSPEDASPAARVPFLRAKETHFRRLRERESPGGAWFRRQADQAGQDAGGASPPEPPATRAPWSAQSEDDLERTYDLFTGGRALAENLQLDRAIPGVEPGTETVPIEDIEGIEIRGFDWATRLGDAEPTLDALSSFVPEDQYAVFFPSFSAMTTLLDEVDEAGTPILQWFESRSEDARSKGRYERQLCLELGGLARLLGPEVIEEVALTGSDPYLREGSDLAVLFRVKPRGEEVLALYHRARQAAAAAGSSRRRQVRLEIDGVPVEGVESEDDSVRSFRAEVDGVVAVSNSFAQLERVLSAARGKSRSLAALDEVRFFRARYPKGDAEETALLVVPDPAIRKWCGPRWRIAHSRRLRAAARLADREAERIENEVAGDSPPPPARDPLYGSLGFLRPIAEIPLTEVSRQEATLYRRWREGYERNWSNVFDPIAVRFSVRPDRVALDLTVMPLILGSEYGELVRITGEGGLPERGGDLHEEALLHWAMSFDPESVPMEEPASFLREMVPSLEAHPFSWMGKTVAVFFDDDPLWAELAETEDLDTYFKTHPIRLPIALVVDVRDPLGLAAFLAGVRAFVQQTAPGMTKWETFEHGGRAYVRIRADQEQWGVIEDEAEVREESDRLTISLFYVTTPSAALLTLDEGLLRRAIDRWSAPKTGEAKPSPWIGNHVGWRARGKVLDVFEKPIARVYGGAMQLRSWGNLPALNEWRRLFPGRDPVEVHREFFATDLVCPGGGEYVWNEAWRTMESTAYGHPGAPRPGPGLPKPLRAVEGANLGLTFEEGGLRARAEIARRPR